MQRAELTFDAALRDSSSERLEARAKAVRNLAPVVLEAIGHPGPKWRATELHPRGDEIASALLRALQSDPDPMIRATAALGLGQLGSPQVLALVRDWVDRA